MRRVSGVQFGKQAACAIAAIALLGASCATHKDSVAIRQELAALQLTTDARLTMIERTVGSLDSLMKELGLDNTAMEGLSAKINGLAEDPPKPN